MNNKFAQYSVSEISPTDGAVGPRGFSPTDGAVGPRSFSPTDGAVGPR
jgi:hypothetical protein